MARGRGAGRSRRGSGAATIAGEADTGGTSGTSLTGGTGGKGKTAEKGKLPLPSPVAGTNLVIADIVLRAAGGLLRERMERGLLVKNFDEHKAARLLEGRGIATSFALWGASRLARRSPLGLAIVAGGLAAKVFYDRGKRLEGGRKRRKAAPPGES